MQAFITVNDNFEKPTTALSIVQSRSSSMFSLFSMLPFIYPRWSVGSRRFCVIAAATCEIIWDPCDIAAPLLTVVHSGLSNNRSPCWAFYHHTRGIEMPPGASKNDRIHTFLPSYNNHWNTILKITINVETFQFNPTFDMWHFQLWTPIYSRVSNNRTYC